MPETVLSIERLVKRFGGLTATNDLSIAVHKGELHAVIGPNGAGKTTLIAQLSGLLTPDSGRIVFNGQDVTALPPAQRRIAMVFQNYALFPHLSVADNIGFGLQVRKVPRAEQQQRVQQVAELVGLAALLARKPGQLSGGQQQRVALARALVSQARVCLMDEPLSNLDAQLRQEMRRELRELQQRLALTVVYVTHDQAEAMSMADQVVLLNKGRIEQAAAPRQLYAMPATTFAARFIGTPAMNLIRLEQGNIAGSRVHVGHRGATLGVRPESITLGGDVPARVSSLEYLGSDLVLRCAIGSEQITVRTDGRCELRAGEQVQLRWPRQEQHFFDAAGSRLD